MHKLTRVYSVRRGNMNWPQASGAAANSAATAYLGNALSGEWIITAPSGGTLSFVGIGATPYTGTRVPTVP